MRQPGRHVSLESYIEGSARHSDPAELFAMSLNDTSLGAMGADMHPGVANPTASSNNANPMDTNFVSFLPCLLADYGSWGG